MRRHARALNKSCAIPAKMAARPHCAAVEGPRRERLRPGRRGRLWGSGGQRQRQKQGYPYTFADVAVPQQDSRVALVQKKQAATQGPLRKPVASPRQENPLMTEALAVATVLEDDEENRPTTYDFPNRCHIGANGEEQKRLRQQHEQHHQKDKKKATKSREKAAKSTSAPVTVVTATASAAFTL